MTLLILATLVALSQPSQAASNRRPLAAPPLPAAPGHDCDLFLWTDREDKEPKAAGGGRLQLALERVEPQRSEHPVCDRCPVGGGFEHADYLDVVCRHHQNALFDIDDACGHEPHAAHGGRVQLLFEGIAFCRGDDFVAAAGTLAAGF